jgi:hypothetical protein
VVTRNENDGPTTGRGFRPFEAWGSECSVSCEDQGVGVDLGQGERFKLKVEITEHVKAQQLENLDQVNVA